MSDKLPPKILVIEHDATLNANLCNTIERYWFDVSRAKNSDEALRLAPLNSPHIIIISSRIQDISAIEMANKIRKLKNMSDIPIIFLIDESESDNNYKLPNNNYVEIIHRPFTPNELMTTIKVMLRKSKPVFQDKTLKYRDILMDLSTYQIKRKEQSIHLGPTEFKILQLFMQEPTSIYSRRQIIDYVWGADKEIAHRTIDVHVNRIRTLLKNKDEDMHLIRTIRAQGYCLD